MALKYQRILLKISGEALGGEKGMGFDEPTMDAICGGVKKAHELGVQIGIVVGGGNFWRGRSSGKMERTLADKIGMLATVMNALAVSDKLEQLGVPTEVFTSITMPQVAQPFTRKEALRAMDEGKIAVFGGGTGNPSIFINFGPLLFIVYSDIDAFSVEQPISINQRAINEKRDIFHPVPIWL